MPANRHTKKTTNTQVPTENPRSELDHLVVMRESAMYDRVLMDGMIRQTLAKVSHLPGAVELAEVGVEIFDNPERYGGIARRSGDSRMVSVERDGAIYHYSMGTAAKNDLPDANAFIKDLIDLVTTYRPRDVWAVAFTRLLRSANLAGDVMKAFTEHIDILHCEAEINLSTPEGRMIFQVLAMIAAAERDYIVRRHTAGRVAQARRGEWIPGGFPPGYAIVDKRLVLVEDSVEQVREMLAILSDGSLTAVDCATKVGALGITTPMVTRLHGDDATVADARNPSEIITTLVGWADSYETGDYEMVWPNPFPGVTDIAGLAVETDPDVKRYPNGVLRLQHELPIPEAGWADAATFDAIRARATVAAITGGASHRVSPPLSRLFRFKVDDHEHALATGKGTYRLLRRPVDPHREFDGWTCESDSDEDRTEIEHVATVSRREWHLSIADAVTQAVRHGLSAELDTTRFQSVDGLPRLDERRSKVRRLQRELGDTKGALGRARRNVSLTDDDDLAADYMAQVERHSRDAKRIEAEMAQLSAVAAAPSLGQSFESNAELVARAMAALANAPDSADSAIAAALRDVIKGDRWWVENKTVHWELCLELPHEEGTIILGPVRGEVPDMALRRRLPGQGRNGRRTTRQALTDAGLGDRAARSAAACPHPELRTVLLAHLNGEQPPDHVDNAWAEHVTAVYTDPEFIWNLDKWRLDDELRREALELIKSVGGRLDEATLAGAGIKREQMRYLSRHVNAPSGDPIITMSGRGAGRVFALVDCPHCGHHADHSVVTPETRPGMLCSKCWRTPNANSPVFPDSYRTTLA